jgi:hypothetical protein
MANGNKQGFFSSIFGGSKKPDLEEQEAAEREARQKLEKRIEQVLAEAALPPKSVAEGEPGKAMEGGKPESVVEMLPITASVLSRRKTTPHMDFWQPGTEADRFAVNQR